MATQAQKEYYGKRTAANKLEAAKDINQASIAAFDAIRKMTESLTALNMCIKNESHITFEWWNEHAAESNLYEALETYELTLRKHYRKKNYK